MNDKMFLTSEKKEINQEERSITAYANRPVLDRDFELVASDCKWVVDDFQKNPVLLLSHNYSIPPVGRVMWLRKSTDGSMIFKAQFAKTATGDELWELYKSGIMNAFSIGFRPVEYEDGDTLDSKSPRRTYKSIELLEISAVSVPSCPDALVIRNDNGMIKTKDLSDAINEIKKIKSLEGDPNGQQKEAKIEKAEEAAESGANCCTKEEEEMGYCISDEEIQTLNKSLDTIIPVIEKSIFDELLDELSPESNLSPIDEILKSIEIEEKAKPSDDDDEDDDKVKFCGCESFNGEDDTCKGCGGRRRKPKKSYYEEIIKEYSKLIPEIKKKAIENKEVNTKLYDVASIPSSPTSRMMKIYCKFLECQVKDIYQNEFLIPSILNGAYLAAFKNAVKNYECVDVRCFGPYDNEYPPSYEVVKINSTIEDDFLTDGQAFYSFNGVPIVLHFFPTYHGQMVIISSSRKNMEINKDLIKSVHKWVETENPLKNEKFSLNKDFIEVDEKDDWDTILLEEKLTKILKLTGKIVKEKDNFSGRGILMVGNPGTGKTKSSRILMSQSNKTFIWVSSKDLQDPWSVVPKIALGFKLARQLAPTILLFEDIDGWITGKIVDLFKTELDGLKKNTGVVTILTTNNPEKLPDALLDRPGRFHDVLEFGYPSKEIRSQMIEKWLGSLEKNVLDSILESTENYSGAHMWELIEFAKSIAEDEDIDVKDAVLRSLEKLTEQKELINRIRQIEEKTITLDDIFDDMTKDNILKEFELEIEEKEFPIEIVEKEIEFTDEEITEIALKIIEEKDYDTVNNMQEIVKESILKLKGRMF